MGKGVFPALGHFRKGAALLRQEKHRIVAEAALTPALPQDDAGTFAPDGELRPVRTDAGNDGDKAGVPPPLRRVLQPLQQKPHPVAVAPRAIPGRMDAGLSAQRSHAEAAVVGQRRQAGDPAGGPGLDQGVFLKGRAGLLRVGMDLRLRHGKEAAGIVFQNGADLRQLMGVVGSDHIRIHWSFLPFSQRNRWPTARFWAAMSCLMPPSASRYISSSSRLEKGRSSPVP